MKKNYRSLHMNQFLAWILLITFANLIHGCYYYKVTKPEEPPKAALIKLQYKKFIILHQEGIAWHLTDLVAGNDTLSGKLSVLKGHDKYKTTDTLSANRYKKNKNIDESNVLTEVHVYIADSIPVVKQAEGMIAFPYTAIRKIELYDKAVGATTASWVFGILGATASVAAVVAIIVMLTKESCPFIYLTEDSSSRFIGEIYSGAIYPSLERHDFLPLPPPKPGQKDYWLKMTNEVHEIQHTNLIELVVFDHPENTKVLLDKQGNYQTITNPLSPKVATSLTGKNILDIVQGEDTLSYFGEELKKDPLLNDGMILKFNRPPDAKTAKLVIKAKNSFWLDYVFTRFHELFGKEYDCWVDKQEKIPEKKMKDWTLDQKIPLLVYIEKKGKWNFVDYFNITGPMAAKEDVLAIDLSDIDTETVNIKLEYGFRFWEVDYAALDFSSNVPVKKRLAYFESAVDNKDKDVKDLLSVSDTLYYVQPEIGDEVNMKFKLPDAVDMEQTLILHSKGYYKILLNLTGEQQKKYLMTFMKKGRFPEFSNELLQQQVSQGNHESAN